MSSDPKQYESEVKILLVLTAWVLLVIAAFGFVFIKFLSWLGTTSFYEFISRPL